MNPRLKKAGRAGAKFACGDDGGAFPHGRPARDFAILVDQPAVPPMEAIRMATRYAADSMGIADRAGTMKGGATFKPWNGGNAVARSSAT